MPRMASASIGSKDRAWLRTLQGRAIGYFLDNQGPDGLVADRQSNLGSPREPDYCSVAATGMGLIAIALASDSTHRLLSRSEAIGRIKTALETGLDRLPNDRGILPHFVDPRTGLAVGEDAFSTVDSGWFFAGALWASAFLGDPGLVELTNRLYNRVDWKHWSLPETSAFPGRIRHGKGPGGRFLKSCWDRPNGETVLMYALAAGAEESRALSPRAWASLDPFYGEAAGQRFHSADLGLFVFQYGLDLLDLDRWRAPCGPDIGLESAVATAANRDACRSMAGRFRTYRHFWGLSAGDGPGPGPGRDAYESYAPNGPVDGTAHPMATLASIAHEPADVLDNVRAAIRLRPRSLGRYGFSTINDDRQWIGPDMVGIDAGAVVMALENVLTEDRLRAVFHQVSCVDRGMGRLGFRDTPAVRLAS